MLLRHQHVVKNIEQSSCRLKLIRDFKYYTFLICYQLMRGDSFTRKCCNAGSFVDPSRWNCCLPAPQPHPSRISVPRINEKFQNYHHHTLPSCPNVHPGMLLKHQSCPILLAAMATRNPATCHFKFQALSGFFVDYVTEAQRDPSFRVTTLPRLGLTEREYETDRLFDGAGHGAKPWDRFKKYVEHLNTQSPEGTTYKVLYITRHGYGYHNAYEAKVGREAWNVRPTFLPRLPSLNPP